MKNLAPNLVRQRLLIEGFYKIRVDRKAIKRYFSEITKALKLQMYGKPVIFSPGGLGKGKNQGYDAFVPLIDSGISVYIWSDAKFASIVLYTCKGFDKKAALRVTGKFFRIDAIESMSF